jgi:hypothetical protein
MLRALLAAVAVLAMSCTADDAPPTGAGASVEASGELSSCADPPDEGGAPMDQAFFDDAFSWYTLAGGEGRYATAEESVDPSDVDSRDVLLDGEEVVALGEAPPKTEFLLSEQSAQAVLTAFDRGLTVYLRDFTTSAYAIATDEGGDVVFLGPCAERSYRTPFSDMLAIADRQELGYGTPEDLLVALIDGRVLLDELAREPPAPMSPDPADERE